MEVVRTVFRQWDVHGTGVIGERHLTRVLTQISGGFPESAVNLILDACEKRPDGKVSYDEFLDLLTQVTDSCEAEAVPKVQRLPLSPSKSEPAKHSVSTREDDVGDDKSKAPDSPEVAPKKKPKKKVCFNSVPLQHHEIEKKREELQGVLMIGLDDGQNFDDDYHSKPEDELIEMPIRTSFGRQSTDTTPQKKSQPRMKLGNIRSMKANKKNSEPDPKVESEEMIWSPHPCKGTTWPSNENDQTTNAPNLGCILLTDENLEESSGNGINTESAPSSAVAAVSGDIEPMLLLVPDSESDDDETAKGRAPATVPDASAMNSREPDNAAGPSTAGAGNAKQQFSGQIEAELLLAHFSDGSDDEGEISLLTNSRVVPTKLSQVDSIEFRKSKQDVSAGIQSSELTPQVASHQTSGMIDGGLLLASFSDCSDEEEATDKNDAKSGPAKTAKGGSAFDGMIDGGFLLASMSDCSDEEEAEQPSIQHACTEPALKSKVDAISPDLLLPSPSETESDSDANPAPQKGEEPRPASPWRPPYVDWSKPIMSRYEVKRSNVLGSGSFSVVRRGVDLQTGNVVAVKTYKAISKNAWAGALVKFQNQVEVELKLQAPFTENELEALRSETSDNSKAKESPEEFVQVEMRTLIVSLLDYSRGKGGGAGPHLGDGMLYIVAELADYTLEKFLHDVKKNIREFTKVESQVIAAAVIRMSAALHCKNFVHLDIKPENIMFSQGHWKLIDIDGSAWSGTVIDHDDDTVSFTPIYCCPEFAAFCCGEADTLKIRPSMDIWSVGLTLLELCLTEPLLKQSFEQICDDTGGDVSAYFSWLGDMSRELDLPKDEISAFDPDFFDLVHSWMLGKPSIARKTCFQCLSHPFLYKEISSEDSIRRRSKFDSQQGEQTLITSKDVDYEDNFWILNAGGDRQNANDWRRVRVCMSITSGKWWIEGENPSPLDGAGISRLRDGTCARGLAFEITKDLESAVLGADTRDLRNKWVAALKQAAGGDIGDHKSMNVVSGVGAKRNALKKTNLREVRAQMQAEGTHFKAKSPDGHTTYYAWMDATDADEMGAGVTQSHGENFGTQNQPAKEQSSSAETSQNGKLGKAGRKWTEDSLSQHLSSHGISVEEYGQGDARSLGDLVKELNNGDCYFQVIDEELIRLFDAVILKISSPEGMTIMELEREMSDGRILGEKQFPAAKRRPHEDVLETALRILRDKLGDIEETKDVSLTPEADLEWEEKESQSYPGIHTIVRKHIVRGEVPSSQSQQTGKRKSITKIDSSGAKRFFTWVQGEQAKPKSRSITTLYDPVGLKFAAQADQSPGGGITPGGPSSGLSKEDEVRALLEEHGIDSSRYGVGEAKSIADLAREIEMGEAQMMVSHGPESSLLRVCDVVCVRLFSPDRKKVLVETWEVFKDGRSRPRGLYPNGKQHANETALKVLETVLGRLEIPTDEVSVKPSMNHFRDQTISPSYPGLQTAYRRRVVECQITSEDPDLLRQIGLLQDERRSKRKSLAGNSPDQRSERRSSQKSMARGNSAGF